MSRRTRSALRLAAAAAAVAVAAAGCGGDERRVAVQPAQPATGYPVVAVPQATAILDAVDRAVAQGAQQRTKAAYGPRVVGPYLDIAMAKAKVDTVRKVKPGVPQQVVRQRLLVPTATGWPRYFVAVGTASGAATPVMRVLQSPDPRSQYGLWSELTMLPGATVPQVASPNDGAPVVALDDGGLVVQPQQVGPRFAEYLNTGGAKGKDLFRPNAFAEQGIARAQADRRELTGSGAATLSSTHTSLPDKPQTFRTADGGALVVVPFQQKYTITVKSGRTVTVNDALAALAGSRTTFGGSFTRNATEVVAFHVPAKGKGQVTVVAAQKGDVSAAVK